jgi:hypothetical protein
MTDGPSVEKYGSAGLSALRCATCVADLAVALLSKDAAVGRRQERLAYGFFSSALQRASYCSNPSTWSSGMRCSIQHVRDPVFRFFPGSIRST